MVVEALVVEWNLCKAAPSERLTFLAVCWNIFARFTLSCINVKSVVHFVTLKAIYYVILYSVRSLNISLKVLV